ncbi:MAG: putative metallopeptidase [Saprospiraceae bacterium]
MPKVFLSIGLTVIFILAGCSGSNPISSLSQFEQTNKSYPLVDRELWALFEKFEVEAKKRGRTIDLAAQEIQATIESVPTPHVGLCNRTANNRMIVIDQDYWVTRSDNKKELLVFHELGHCSLNLGHQKDQAGSICKSIMRSGLDGCIDNYNATNRTQYLNDLFAILD